MKERIFSIDKPSQKFIIKIEYEAGIYPRFMVYGLGRKP